MILEPSIATRARPFTPSTSTASVAGWGDVLVEGDTSLLTHPSVAIIGSRQATHEGRTATRKFALRKTE